MNTIVKNIVKSLEKKQKDCCFEVFYLDNNLILFANRGSIETIQPKLNKKLSMYNLALRKINDATAHIIKTL